LFYFKTIGDYYSAVELAQIAQDLDNEEHKRMAESGTTTKEYEKFLGESSSNYDDSGFFSIQVLQKALNSWNLELIPFSSQNEIAKLAKDSPTEQNAYICNFRQHWYTIRKIAKYWFNLNSLLKKPQLITDTYLSILLAQLENDGYSIFIVYGDLPKSMADIRLLEEPLNVKEMLKNSRNANRVRKYTNDDDDDFNADDLKEAIKMSLIENDLDLDNHRLSKLYPSLAHEQQGDNDKDLKKAIEMSLQSGGSTKANNTENAATSNLNPEEMRAKRLAYLNNLQNNCKKE
jgi:Ataxin-3